MKKKMFLLLFLIFITGCDAKYEIVIYNNNIKESISYYYTSNELNGNTPYEHTMDINFKYLVNADMLMHEKKTNVNKGNMSGVKLLNNYKNLEDFKENSMLLSACYIATSVTEIDNYITLKTSNEFTCFNTVEELDEVKIVIKSNHKLKSTNADKKKGATYYWYINKDNYKEKPISLVLHSNKKVWYYDVLKKLILIISVIGGTVLVAFTGYKLYKKREENVNF